MKDEDLNKITGAVVRAIDARLNKRPASYYSEAQVLRVDEKNGVAYVHIPGGVDETPVKLTIDAAKGDTVQIRVGEGSATIVGNQTAPPTDDKLAEEALQEAETAASGLQEIDEALENGDFDAAEISNVVTWYCMSTSNSSFNKATGYDWQTTIPTYTAGLYYWTKTVTTLDDGTEVESDPIFDLTAQAAAEADAIATSNGNHFWHNGTGVYVTKTANNASSGYATRIVSEGIQHTYNGSPLFTLSSSALTFNQSDGTTPMATYGSGGTTLYANGDKAAEFLTGGIKLYDPSSTTYPAAQFLSSGAVIGKSAGSHIEITSSQMDFYGDSGYYCGYINGSDGDLEIHSRKNPYIELSATGVIIKDDSRTSGKGVFQAYSIGAADNISAGGNAIITGMLSAGALYTDGSLFKITSTSITVPSISANGSTGTLTENAGTSSEEKYYPLAIAGFRTGKTTITFVRLLLQNPTTGGATISYNLHNTSSSATDATTGEVQILWVKNTI